MSDWRDFSTAPKDGKLFFAFDPILGLIGCRYEVPAEDDEWEEGFAFRGFMDGDYLFNCEPTHWQPLPKPPAEADIEHLRPSDSEAPAEVA